MGKSRTFANVLTSVIIFILILWIIFPERFLPSAFLVTVIFGFPILIILLFIVFGFRIFARNQLQRQSTIHRPRDSAIITRVVIERTTGSEVIIEGGTDTTFREALLHDWPFPEIPVKSSWIIQDEVSNDITDRPLSSYGGIAELVGTYDPGVSYEDESDRYSSIDDGVVYYD
ncbi:MAG: hypothetical protein RTU30_09010 [Candidatus Thorarchaeota archaeon]